MILSAPFALKININIWYPINITKWVEAFHLSLKKWYGSQPTTIMLYMHRRLNYRLISPPILHLVSLISLFPTLCSQNRSTYQLFWELWIKKKRRIKRSVRQQLHRQQFFTRSFFLNLHVDWAATFSISTFASSVFSLGRPHL